MGIRKGAASYLTITDHEAMRLYDDDMAFRNLSSGSRSVRARYLSKLSREIGFANVTEQNLTEWLSRPSLGPKSRGMLISTYHAFFSWSLRGNAGKPIYPPDAEGAPFLPTATISKPRNHPRHPRPMPLEDIRKALAQAPPNIRCWIACGAFEGMRCQEIAFLAAEDISEDNGTLEITHGKGQKMRYVPLHPEVLKAIQELPMPEQGRLWPDETAASISRKGNRFLHGAGVVHTMHQLRHSFASRIYQSSGGDIVLVSGLLGHSSIATTQIYAQADVSKASGVVTGLTI